MDLSFIVLVSFVVLFVLWVLLPLVPAWITYHITPEQTLGVKGPLKGLTLKATGAFAAYLIVLLITYNMPKEGMSLLGALTHPAWKVNADVVVIGRDGKPAQLPPKLDTMSVTFHPDLHTISRNSVSLRIPGHLEDWPKVTFQIPSFGGSPEMDLSTLGEDKMEIDGYRKLIRLKTPIIIRQFPADDLGFGIGKSP